MNRLSIALVLFVVLAILTWSTITDSRLRAGTLLILGLFAVKTLVRRNDVMHPDAAPQDAAAEEAVDKG